MCSVRWKTRLMDEMDQQRVVAQWSPLQNSSDVRSRPRCGNQSVSIKHFLTYGADTLWLCRPASSVVTEVYPKQFRRWTSLMWCFWAPAVARFSVKSCCLKLFLRPQMMKMRKLKWLATALTNMPAPNSQQPVLIFVFSSVALCHLKKAVLEWTFIDTGQRSLCTGNIIWPLFFQTTLDLGVAYLNDHVAYILLFSVDITDKTLSMI